LTPNYVRMIERARAERQTASAPAYQPATGFDRVASQSLDVLLSDPKLLILSKIHGSFRDNGTGQESRLIITEDDYIEFLTVATRKDDPVGVPLLIESELVDSTLLFLGYSLEDWDFRTIYKGLIEKLQYDERRTSF